MRTRMTTKLNLLLLLYTVLLPSVTYSLTCVSCDDDDCFTMPPVSEECADVLINCAVRFIFAEKTVTISRMCTDALDEAGVCHADIEYCKAEVCNTNDCNSKLYDREKTLEARTPIESNGGSSNEVYSDILEVETNTKDQISVKQEEIEKDINLTKTEKITKMTDFGKLTENEMTSSEDKNKGTVKLARMKNVRSNSTESSAFIIIPPMIKSLSFISLCTMLICI